MADRFQRFVPITKIDVEKREVHGFLAEEAPDKSGEIFDYETSTPYFKEWSEGFDDSARTLVVAMQGTEHRLTGTAEAQYEEWQRLLRQMFISETGFVPEEIEIYAEPTVAPPEPAVVAVDPSVAAPAPVAAAPTDAAAAAGTGTTTDKPATDGAAIDDGAAADGAPGDNTVAPKFFAPNAASDDSGEATADGRGSTPADV